ncbi:MAG: AAC(3) family N-acetyltransferase [Chloroflexi bacterium HGW-Chloroflexi-1]|nr:MAG: AAC(3) family N-acetyltransferase [Chloroflexi bacterium HGW-Chloroflexi-1]
MTEADAIRNTQGGPNTIQSITADLAALGVAPGMTLLVHATLSRLGWVCGGPVAVILALETALGPTGTLVMPTHSGDLSDPAQWENPPVPETWWAPIRQTMPAYDLDMTPTRGMGAIPECFRKQRGVVRSGHPQVSFAAWGARASEIVADHALDFAFGEDSPLARIYDLDGWILLLGVTHDNNTSLHLAETRTPYPERKLVENGAPVLVDGRRQWVKLRDIDSNTADFETIGAAFARETGLVRSGRVGNAPALLMPQRALVDYAGGWMMANRKAQD